MIALLLLPFAIQAQIITTIAGGGTAGLGDGGAATAAQLGFPQFVRIDSAGNIYIADTYNHRIRKVNNAGIITTIAGNGTANYSGDGGQATDAGIGVPVSVAISKSGKIYIAEDTFGINQGSEYIREITTDGIIRTIAGNGIAGYSGDGGQATAAGFGQIRDMAVDDSANIFIVDNEDNRIRKINSAGIISTFAYANSPNGIAIDKFRNIYFSESGKYVIKRIDTAGMITTVAGNGLQGYFVWGELNDPFGIAVDDTGYIYVADVANNCIGKGHITDSAYVYNIAGDGVASFSGFSGDGGQGTAARLHYPTGVAVDCNGNVFIADQMNNRIRKISNSLSVNSTNNILESIEYYPNPIKNEINISATFIIKEVEIINAIGQIVFKKLYDTYNEKIKIENLPRGIYFIKVNNQYSQKVIKE